MPKPSLAWLPQAGEFNMRLKHLQDAAAGIPGPECWTALVALARLRLDFLRTDRLDVVLQAAFQAPPQPSPSRQVRLALLGSSTTAHLPASIRVAGLRRNIHVSIHEGEYGQYLQELGDVNSALHRFGPDTVLLALDARHVTAGLAAGADAASARQALQAIVATMRSCWRLAADLGAQVIQQAILPVLPGVAGNNEQRMAGSKAAMIVRLNAALREAADADGVQVLAIDEAAARDGIGEWHDPALWHRTRQEISPVATPVYGDLVGRLLAALQGRSAKCLVLDLDNTLWGGVAGDDGIEGIELGHGSAAGEAHLAVQCYAKALAERGVILAVCSKNDETVARAVFDHHPEMLLRRSDIAAFVANWDDKATNLQRIATTLNIGVDSLVLLDDSAFERDLVRAALPDVAVPEVPDDEPALMPGVLADAGYFETVSVTAEDRARVAQYSADRARIAEAGAAADVPAYLASLGMTLTWRRFEPVGLQRIVQLVNKTNQFNLTTRRTTTSGIQALIDDPHAFGLQFRLADRHGECGIIAVAICRLQGDGVAVVENWLMSCRVLGRNVEQATLAVIVAQAKASGAQVLAGDYIPSGRNAMVSTLYGRLGFTVGTPAADGGHRAMLDLRDFAVPDAAIAIVEGA
ncbi:HAD-IIIC family phosphatase [Lichenicoccus roseus]|uniref:HAD-IIIC family phosphatase n=1 Tax=Lichenicoccus roseus TaxID=2683649 RepID=A0A5R9J5B1_9PROT|nr:HAD-IIIC family phosphatase [Lichenicoccus roseus]TLU70801.1 HAD-IIIC family phosphatase [Lichenicoccus roseus]